MPTQGITLEYAPVLPKRSVARQVVGWVATAVRIFGRWSWRNRAPLAAVVASAIAGWVVALSWQARVIEATPAFECRTRGDGLLLVAVLCLPGIFPAWWVARRGWWSVRLARVSFAVAAVWFVYVILAIKNGWVPWRP
jgi:hypothetical protein